MLFILWLEPGAYYVRMDGRQIITGGQDQAMRMTRPEADRVKNEMRVNFNYPRATVMPADVRGKR